jgi:hypothetical protein
MKKTYAFGFVCFPATPVRSGLHAVAGLGVFVLAGVLLVAIGCSEQTQVAQSDPHSHAHECVEGCSTDTPPWSREDLVVPDGIDASKYVLGSEPEGARNVIAVREAVQNDDDVVIQGRIGGESPWIENRAAFTIVDPSIDACSDIPGDDCPTPWDYCCRTDQLPQAMALVVLVDENDVPVPADTRALLDVKELSTVVVQGKAKRDNNGNLTVFAKGVYVK